jgi:hypothetical protein
MIIPPKAHQTLSSAHHFTTSHATRNSDTGRLSAWKTCRAYPQTTPYLHVHIGNRSGRSAGHAACCLLPATIAHTRRLHRPSYHCHTVAQFHLETEHSSKPSRPRVSQRLWAHQDEMIYDLRTCALLVANTLLEPPPLEIITTHAISNANTSLLRSRRRSRFQSAPSSPHAVSLSNKHNDVRRAKNARTGCLDTFR